MTLERTPDILAGLGQARGGAARPVLVGFAAQTGDVLDAARRKLAAKHVDLIVANDVSRSDAGFEVDTNAVTIVGAHGAEVLPLMTKTRAAAEILDRVERLLAGSPAATRALRN